MEDTNSYAEFALGLFAAQFKDCATLYPALTKEFERDLSRLSSAVDCHGIRFVLDIMPGWRKHFDSCLAAQRLIPSRTCHFGVCKKGGVIPRFLRGLTLRVFDLNGELKPDPDIQAIRCIRQLLGVARRIRLPCSAKHRSDAVRDFVRTDLELRRPDLDWSQPEKFDDSIAAKVSFLDAVVSTSESKQGTLFPDLEVPTLEYRHAECIQQVADYISACLGQFDPHEWRFKHGPGAVADQRFGAHKYAFRQWPDRLDKIFPQADFAVANYGLWEDSSLYKEPQSASQREIPAKLHAVPKTITTPRLIAAEPTSLAWCQQSIRDFLYTRVQRSILGAFVDFRRQDINGQVALEASHTGRAGTIDLSSASDRVSCWHVERLFRRSPSLLGACGASRSVFIRQDICRMSPKLHLLRKYSTMGNATTFPVQSLFFLAVILGTALYVRRKELWQGSIRDLIGDKVRVFGDDLIVPADCAGATVDALHALGLRVNSAKTFLTGKFRESCGVDAYDGHDVTSVGVLEVPKQAGPGSVVSCVDVHNNFVSRGWLYTSSYMRKTVEALRVYQIRGVTHGSGLFGWYPNWIDPIPSLRRRRNESTQLMEVRCHSPKAKVSAKPSEEGAALLQFFTEAAKVVEVSKSTLVYPLQRAKTPLRLGWVPVEQPS